jgi:hypothetical protein
LRSRRGRRGLVDLEGVGVVLEHLPPEPGALAGIDVDVVRLSEAPAEEHGQLKLSPRGTGEEEESGERKGKGRGE